MMERGLAFLSILVLTLVLTLSLSAMAYAQPQPSKAYQDKQAAMEKAAFLVGTWEGEGWIQRGEQRATFRGTETIRAELDGLLVLVEGRHLSDVPGQDEPVVVHHAFAILSYDTEAGVYRFDTHLASGGSGAYTATVGDRTMVWEMDHAQAGHIRYTIEVSEDGRWHEVGEVETDQRWHQFFEMTLQRRD